MGIKESLANIGAGEGDRTFKSTLSFFLLCCLLTCYTICTFAVLAIFRTYYPFFVLLIVAGFLPSDLR